MPSGMAYVLLRSLLTVTSNPTTGNGKTQSLLDPQLAERLWLAMAVATLWMVMPGGEAENQSPEPNLSPLPPPNILSLVKLSTSNLYVSFLVFFWVLLP